MAYFGVDLTACWRPRVGMVTLAVELTRALVEQRGEHRLAVFASRSRPAGLERAEADFVLSPYRHELAQKALWLPFVEAAAGLDAILYPYWPSPPLRRRGAAPAAVYVHDLAFRLRPKEVPWQQRLYLSATLRRALRHAAAVAIPSQTTRADLVRIYGGVAGLEAKLHVIPEGPTPLSSSGPLPPKLKPGFLLAVGTVEPRKNYDRLLAAYRRLRLRRDARLVVVGRPGWDHGSTLFELQAQPGLAYLGHVDDATLAALYEHASALVFPSLYEGFGLPLLDALARGLPALISNRGALPELASGAALEVDPEDEAALAAGMERVLADAGLRRRLAAAGRKRAAEFSWESSGAAMLRVLESIAGKERAPALVTI